MASNKFVPIPYSREHLTRSRDHWLPFLPAIARAGKQSLDEVLEEVISGRVQIGIIWNGEKALALIGLQTRRRGDQTVGEIVWASGPGMTEWRELLPAVEQYLKEHFKCDICKPICRPGWQKFLKTRGYRTTHVMMERAL